MQQFSTVGDVTDDRPLCTSSGAMINTYHTSVAPPPVPPRLHRSHQAPQPMLIPTQVLPQGHSRSLMRFMIAVVLLNLLMSVMGFIYLYMNGRQVQQNMYPSFAETGTETLMQKQHSNHIMPKASPRAFAHMVFKRPTADMPRAGYLQWNTKYSRYSRPHINYYNNSWLTIEESGDYFVYSRVTFSKHSPTSPLINRVQLRKTKTDKEKKLMEAFCHLGYGTNPSVCTATTEDIIKLEKGNQLSVWTEDLSLVDYDEASTAFGLYSLP